MHTVMQYFGNIMASEKMQQYTCPECSQGGAHWADSPAPLCHKCDYKVTMKKSHNGKIIEEVK